MVSAKRTFDSLNLMQDTDYLYSSPQFSAAHCYLSGSPVNVVPTRNTLHEHVICANNIVTCKCHLKDVDLSPYVNCISL